MNVDVSIMDLFERAYRGRSRLDREDETFWEKGHVYQHGEVNELFQAFLSGYDAAKNGMNK